MTLQIVSLALVGTLVASELPQAVAQMSRISGQVIEDGTNTPVADARVFVVLDAERAPDGSLPDTLSDRNGRYRFDMLPPGRYHIAAQKEGFAPPMDPSTMQTIEVAAGQVLEDVTVSLRRGGAFAGHVLDPQGHPIANVGVTALLKRLNLNEQRAGVPPPFGAPLLMPSGQGQTNDLGEFRIVGLWPGDYLIVAGTPSKLGGAATQPSSGMTATATYFPGTADVSAAQPLAVEAGQTVSDLTIPLVSVAAFKISGVVVDTAGNPVANAMVMLMGGQGGTDFFLSLVVGTPLMSQSDASGRFTFGGVPAGAYTMRADTGGGIGFFGVTDAFGIDSDGTPRVDPSQPKPPREPGTIEVSVENGDVDDVRVVVPGSR
jgi:carboxypeptidase family protein